MESKTQASYTPESAQNLYFDMLENMYTISANTKAVIRMLRLEADESFGIELAELFDSGEVEPLADFCASIAETHDLSVELMAELVQNVSERRLETPLS